METNSVTREVITWSLQMLQAGNLRPSPRPRIPGLALVRAEIPCPELNRFLYAAVGGAWFWMDRLAWTGAQWMEWLDRPELETWVAYERGTPAGYFELEAQPGANVEIAYFGLLPAAIGRGLGGWMLTEAVRRAWEMQTTERVWVHTCSLDSPAALRNYLSRGFAVFREDRAVMELPRESPGPGPGWRTAGAL